jgi:hypothetical protein
MRQRPSPACRRGTSGGSDSLNGAAVRLAGSSWSDWAVGTTRRRLEQQEEVAVLTSDQVGRADSVSPGPVGGASC